MTTTTHRPGCPRPGWTVENSRTMRGVSISRCLGCQAVELRTEPMTTPRLTNDRPTEGDRP